MGRGSVVRGRLRKWHVVLAAMVIAAALAVTWYQYHGRSTDGRSSVVDVSGRSVGAGIVPTRTEPSSTSPRILHPQQAGKPASGTGATLVRIYSVHPGPDASSGTAILGASPESARTYVAGAILEDGTVVSGIRADHVVLERDGRSYTLYTEGAEPPTGGGVGDSAAQTTLRLNQATLVQQPSTSSARVEDMVRYTPTRSGSEIAGLVLYPGRHGRYFQQWGLQGGDVLLSLGDASAGDIERLTEQLRSLADGRSLPARVHRGTEEIQVLFDGGSHQ